MKKCKAVIMAKESPERFSRCDEPCSIIVDKTKPSIRYEIPGQTAMFLYQHEHKDYCFYHQKLKDKRTTPHFPKTMKGL